MHTRLAPNTRTARGGSSRRWNHRHRLLREIDPAPDRERLPFEGPWHRKRDDGAVALFLNRHVVACSRRLIVKRLLQRAELRLDPRSALAPGPVRLLPPSVTTPTAARLLHPPASRPARFLRRRRAFPPVHAAVVQIWLAPPEPCGQNHLHRLVDLRPRASRVFTAWAPASTYRTPASVRIRATSIGVMV